MLRKEIVAACQIHLSVQLYYLIYVGVSRLISVATLCYKPLKSTHYVPTYLAWFTEKSDLTMQWTILNTSSHKHICKFDSQHVRAHAWHVLGFCSAIFKHVHVMDVQMCVCSSLVLGIFWENAWVDIGYLRCAVCIVRHYVTACMSASVPLFVSIFINYVRHVQMSKYWCFGWGWRTHIAEAWCLRWMCEARHRTTCTTDRHIRTDKLSQGAAHLTRYNVMMAQLWSGCVN